MTLLCFSKQFSWFILELETQFLCSRSKLSSYFLSQQNCFASVLHMNGSAVIKSKSQIEIGEPLSDHFSYRAPHLSSVTGFLRFGLLNFQDKKTAVFHQCPYCHRNTTDHTWSQAKRTIMETHFIQLLSYEHELPIRIGLYYFTLQ